MPDELRGSPVEGTLRVMTSSDAALLSSLRTQIDDLVTRVLAVAESNGRTPDSPIAVELFAAERSLIAAGRSISRAAASAASARG